MDTVTHALLGAATGNAALGRRVGNKAMLWGAGIALLPDIDVPLGYFLSDLDELVFHRSITHSLLFVLATALLLGVLLARLNRRDAVGWRSWAGLCAAVLSGHVLLDAFTSYGVQLLLPFDNTAFALASISVIDPLFTLPLLVAVAAILPLPRDRVLRRWLGYGALGLSAAYLGLTVANKLHMQTVFKEQLLAQGVEARRLFVKPTFLNNLLWRGIAETDDAYWVGFRSLRDTTPHIEFLRFEKNHHLLGGLEESVAVRRLRWVTKGYLTVERTGEDLYVHDMRYGKAFEWMRTERDFVFTYRLVTADGEEPTIKTIPQRVDRARERESFRELLQRIWGV